MGQLFHLCWRAGVVEAKLARGLLLLINCEGDSDPGGGRDIQGVFFLPISGAREKYKSLIIRGWLALFLQAWTG